MMALVLRDRTHAVDEVERLLKIGELENAVNVMFVHYLPVGKLMAQCMQLTGTRFLLSKSDMILNPPNSKYQLSDAALISL